MSNLERCKDRSPLDTVNIIRDFFSQYNYTVEEEINKISEIGTYWCGLSLYYNNCFICRSNGKGTTKEYALASGYGELYERFCGGFGTLLSDWVCYKKVMMTNKETYGYYIHPREKFVSFDEIRNSCDKFKYLYSKVEDADNNFLKIFNLKLNYNQDKSLVIPYTDFCTGEDRYYSQFLIDLIQGSSGLSAGNSLEEALTQGISEALEHCVFKQIYDNRQHIYYQLNLEKMSLSTELNNIINVIKELNYDIYVYDLSYNYNLPVILTLLINKNNNNWYIDLGSHPVIDIAIERTLTELYQGYVKIDSIEKDRLFPSKNMTHFHIMELNPNSIVNNPIYPEDLIFNRTLIDSYNKEIFLQNDNYTNKDLNDYYKKIISLLNLNVSYYNLSLSKEMFAVRVFIDNVLPHEDIHACLCNEEYNKLMYNILNEYNCLLNNEQVDLQNLIQNLNVLNDMKFNGVTLCKLYDHILTPVQSIDHFYKLLGEHIIYNPFLKPFQKEYFYYRTIFLYEKAGYSISEIESLLSLLNLSKATFFEDIKDQNYTNINFLFIKLILENYCFIYNNSLSYLLPFQEKEKMYAK